MDETFRTRLAAAIEPYAALLLDFVRGSLNADEFQSAYLRSYLSDDRVPGYDVFRVVDGFFALVDSYVEDAALRDASDPTSDDMRREAARLLSEAGHDVQLNGIKVAESNHPR